MSLAPDSSYKPSADPMMEELREIRDLISQTISPLTSEERVRFFYENAKAIAASLGRELRPHPSIPNAQIMVLIQESANEA